MSTTRRALLACLVSGCGPEVGDAAEQALGVALYGDLGDSQAAAPVAEPEPPEPRAPAKQCERYEMEWVDISGYLHPLTVFRCTDEHGTCWIDPQGSWGCVSNRPYGVVQSENVSE